MATQNSNLMANTLASPPVLNPQNEQGANMRADEWSQAFLNGVDGEVYRLTTVPRNVRFMTPYCRLTIPAQGAARVLSMGWQAYRDAEGTEIAADAAGFFSALDVSGAVDNLIDSLTVTGLLATKLFEGDAVITLTITGDTAVAGDFAGTIVTAGL